MSHPIPSCHIRYRSRAILGRREDVRHILSTPRLRRPRFPTRQMSSLCPGSRLAPRNAKPQAPPFFSSWSLMPASGSPASLCPEPNGLLQPMRTVARVCVGLGPRRCTEHPFTPRPARWADGGAGGWGKRCGGGGLDGPQSGRCRPPDPAETTQSASVSWAPTWPPSQALCPRTLALGHLPGAGGKMSFYSLSSRLCQGWLGTCGA